MHSTDRRPGFTLIEVVVALAIIGLTIGVAAGIARTVGMQAEWVAVGVRDAQERANGERLLRRLVGQMRFPGRDEPAMRGDASGLQFATWCDVPSGWQERCTATLALVDDPRGYRRLEVSTTRGERWYLASSVALEQLLYLRSAAHGGSWDGEWVDTGSLPPAIGLVIAGDTLILRAGSRG